jgi:hypothetical protein
MSKCVACNVQLPATGPCVIAKVEGEIARDLSVPSGTATELRLCIECAEGIKHGDAIVPAITKRRHWLQNLANALDEALGVDAMPNQDRSILESFRQAVLRVMFKPYGDQIFSPQAVTMEATNEFLAQGWTRIGTAPEEIEKMEAECTPMTG